jgi:hypothetical protein
MSQAMGVERSTRHASVEIKSSPNRLTELRLLIIEQYTDLTSQSLGWNRGDAVAAHDRRTREPVRRINVHLGGESANRGRDRRDP